MWYEIAKKDYCNGFKPAAWSALGHVLHLVQDVTVPAHSHGTANFSLESHKEKGGSYV